MSLLDTNVVSELGRPRPNRGVIEFISSRPIESLYSTSIVMAELRRGIDALTEPDRRLFYSSWLSETIRPMFGARVLNITEDVVLRWLLLARETRQRGRTYPEPDLLLGAVALHNGMTLVTRNVRDFDGAGVPVLNPWSD